MSKWIGSVLLCTGMVIACGRGGHGGGDGSGIPGTTPFVVLSAAEITQLCEYLAELIGEKRDIDCGGGQTITVGGADAAGCISAFQRAQQMNQTCTVDVDAIEDCFVGIATRANAEWCANAPPPTACQPLVPCGLL